MLEEVLKVYLPDKSLWNKLIILCDLHSNLIFFPQLEIVEMILSLKQSSNLKVLFGDGTQHEC